MGGINRESVKELNKERHKRQKSQQATSVIVTEGRNKRHKLEQSRNKYKSLHKLIPPKKSKT